MFSFESDYTEGAHPKVLKALADTNLETVVSYGGDKYSASAAEKIKAACASPDSDVYFLTGRTQTNQIVISSLLKQYEGVVAATTGHVNVHEAGAIEFSGHKVLALPSHDGKVCARELEEYIDAFYKDPSFDHMVFPGMVYISHPTELGTLYTKAELEAISKVCREKEIYLYLDGARLGYGLMSDETDVTFADVARLTDVFYIGGTKVGALCGEAVVFKKGVMPKYFATMVKQNGAMLAKGRLLGVQFDALFTDGLYFEVGRHGIDMANRLKKIFSSHGIEFSCQSPTNQQFVYLDDETFRKLDGKVKFELWERCPDGRISYRFVTSWATADEALEELDRLLS